MATDTPSLNEKTVLLIEPFYGGSHKQLVDTLLQEVGANCCELVTLSAKKWHWRARTSALVISDRIPSQHTFQVLFASSVLNLAELIALRPDLSSLKKIVYFHENQLVYPVKKTQERDFQYGYNQILTCCVADRVIFNSIFNKDSFLNSVDKHLRSMPDYVPKNICLKFLSKCEVIYFPIQLPLDIRPSQALMKDNKPLTIVWPHRWEHDKNPELFFHSLFILLDEDVPFQVSVLGESFTDIPEIFNTAKERLEDRIKHWGFLPSKQDYYQLLSESDVVVSTALHEFFGVSVVEAVSLGCYPLCPNRLSYPELFPTDNLYNTDKQLIKRLRRLCQRPDLVRDRPIAFDCESFSWNKLKGKYLDILL